VINLLCDRSLEEAYASRIRLVDRPLILTAGRALGVVGATGTPVSLNEAAPTTQAKADKSFWPVTKATSETADPIAHHIDETAVHHADETAPVVLSALTRPAPAPRFPTYVALATAAALAALAIMFGVRWARTPAAQAPPSAAAPASSTNRPPSVRQEPAPLGADVLQPKTAATGGTPTPPAATAPVAAPEGDRVRTDRREVTQLHDPRFEPTPVAPTPAGERFDIVVASFRTDARAASVAAQVTALGLPIRRRVSDGWQQVLSGPFPSRTDAEKAQQRLRGAGLGGTQVVPTVR
jgi:cell division protein FtsN